ncbi:hypothetical protein AB0M54_24535 [Actinoplanes sp. NPDC051470]|uniref:hypothetical protein n=1 Tax=Actinoplanes sp. NPDC051470 TaxID=3157224 RepID=UPI0034340F55
MTLHDHNLRRAFGDRCQHGVQFLNECDDCPGGWQPDPVDQAIEAAGWVNRNGPDYHRAVHPRRIGGRFHWDIADHSISPHLPAAKGRAWTRRGAWRQLERAYQALLRGDKTEATGLRDRRGDGLVP